MKVSSTLLVSLLAIIELGCLGKNSICPGSCPTGQIHDSFCGCMDDFGNPSQGTPPSPKYPTLSSACICKLPAGQTEAWFTYPPTGFDGLRGKNVNVASSRCIDIVACPMLTGDDRCQPDGDKPQQCFVTGEWGMSVESTQINQSLITGKKSWALIGEIGPPLSEMLDPLFLEDQKTTDQLASQVPLLPAVEYSGMLTLISAPGPNDSGPKMQSQSSNLAECEDRCSQKKAFCLRTNLDDKDNQIGKVQQVRSMLGDKNRTSITELDLLHLFNLPTQDTCTRTDTFIKDNQIINSGAGCKLSSSVVQNSLVAFTVFLPEKLQGTRRIGPDKLTLLFDAAAEAPTVEIGDKGLNNEYGGVVQGVSVTLNGGVISTESGCIAVGLNK
jgi:hypothetical protein